MNSALINWERIVLFMSFSFFQVANLLWISLSCRQRRDGRHRANWFLLTWVLSHWTEADTICNPSELFVESIPTLCTQQPLGKCPLSLICIWDWVFACAARYKSVPQPWPDKGTDHKMNTWRATWNGKWKRQKWFNKFQLGRSMKLYLLHVLPASLWQYFRNVRDCYFARMDKEA